MDKIQITSRVLRYLFYIPMLLIPVSLSYFWQQAPLPIIVGNPDQFFISLSFIPHGLQISMPFTNALRWQGLFVSAIPYAVLILIFYYVSRLFHLYEQKQIFTLHNVTYIRRIGISLILLELIVNPLSQMLLSLLLTLSNPVGHRTVAMSLDSTNLGLLITGTIVLLISWIMSEGHKLEEEQKLTV